MIAAHRDLCLGRGRVRGWHCTSCMHGVVACRALFNSKLHVPNPICSILPNLSNPVPTHLGGDDLDNCLVEYCIADFTTQTGQVSMDLAGDWWACRRLRRTCKDVKHLLSSRQTLSNQWFQTFSNPVKPMVSNLSNLFKPCQTHGFQTFQTFSNPVKPTVSNLSNCFKPFQTFPNPRFSNLSNLSNPFQTLSNLSNPFQTFSNPDFCLGSPAGELRP